MQLVNSWPWYNWRFPGNAWLILWIIPIFVAGASRKKLPATWATDKLPITQDFGESTSPSWHDIASPIMFPCWKKCVFFAEKTWPETTFQDPDMFAQQLELILLLPVCVRLVEPATGGDQWIKTSVGMPQYWFPVWKNAIPFLDSWHSEASPFIFGIFTTILWLCIALL